MKKTKKLWIAVFALAIALTMAATVFLAVGFAEDAPEDGYVLVDGNFGAGEDDEVALYYNAETKTAKICGKGYVRPFEGKTSYFRENSTRDVKNAETVIIEDGIQNISEDLFYGAVHLKSVTVPASVTGINSSAFFNCTSLETLYLPGSVRGIGCYAFYGCTSLTEVTLSEGLVRIKYGAFGECTSLERITLPDSLQDIEYEVFENCTSLESISLPNSLQGIGDDVFKDCTSLETVRMPSASGTVCCFSGCTALTEIVLPEGVTELGYRYDNDFLWIHEHGIHYAFKGCTSLERVTLPSTLQSIGEEDFSGCGQLTSINFPQSLTSIGANAFSGCSSLSELTFCRNELIIVGDYAFPSLAGADIYTCYDSEAAFFTHIRDAKGELYNPFSGEYNVIPNAHDIVYMPKAKTTGTFAGLKAHYECKKCGAMYTDAAGTSEKPYDYFVPKFGAFFTRMLNFFRNAFEFIHRFLTH